MVPLPVSESRLCKFVSYLADQNLKHRTIKMYLSGMCYFQIKSGGRDPFHNDHMPHLEYTMKGIKRVESQNGTTPRMRLTITPPMLNERGVVGLGNAARHQANTGGVLSGVLCFFLRVREMTTPDDGGYGSSSEFQRYRSGRSHYSVFSQSEDQAVQDRPVPQRGRSVPWPHGIRYLSHGSPIGLLSM